MLTVSQTAPLFTSVDQNNNKVSLADYAGQKNIVLYFYPKDDTSGCTIEANQFTNLVSEFESTDTVVLGVSKDSCESHRAFIKKFNIALSLLADTDGSLCDKYGTWQEKVKNGESKMGIVRSTFIINKSGIIEYAEYGVTADGHADAILQRVKKLA
jgi:peroxiredoxin